MLKGLIRFAVSVSLLIFSVTACADENLEERLKLRLHVESGIEFVTDHEVPPVRLQEMAACVQCVQQQMTEELGTPSIEQTVRIYLFGQRGNFSRFVQKNIHSVRWSETLVRHGMFLLREGRPYIFLVSSDKLVSHLRHECVHAVLNTSCPRLPIWIDEGLAQCFEDPGGGHWNDQAARVLQNDILKFAPPSAESLGRRNSMSQMGPREYAGAWAFMQFALDDVQTRRPAIRDYLTSLRNEQSDAKLQIDFPRLNRELFWR